MKYTNKQQLESLVKRLLQEELEMHIKQLREAEESSLSEEDIIEANKKSSRLKKYVKSKAEPNKVEEPSSQSTKLKVGDFFREPGDEDVVYNVKEIKGDEYVVDTIENGKSIGTNNVKIKNIDRFIEDGDYEKVEAKKGTDKEDEAPTDDEPSSKEDTQEEPGQPQDAEVEEPATEETPEEEAPKEKGATAWEKIKYGLSKLGTYKVNGRLFGRKKLKKETAEKVKAALAKASDERVQKLDDTIREKDPEFPNGKKQDDFLSSVISIAALYDSIVTAVGEEGKGNLPPDAANELINTIRDYVKKALDTDLAAVYSTLDENKQEDLEEIDEDAAADVRTKLKADRETRTKDGDASDFKSTRIDTLKSNKLPIALTALGGSLGAFGWLTNTEWFKKLFTTLTPQNYEEKVKVASKDIIGIKKGEGVYRLLSRVTGIPLDANLSPENLVKSLEQIGGGDAEKGAEQLCQKGGVMMKPDQALARLKEFLDNPNKFSNLGQFFKGEAIGTGKLSPVDTTLFGTIEGAKLESIILSTISRTATRLVSTTSAGYGVAKGLGAVALPLGIALVTAGALVKIMRIKGQKTSRAATLNALYQSLRNVPKGVVVKPEGEVDSSIEVGTPNLTAVQGGPQGGTTGAAGATGDAGATGAKAGKPDSSKKKGEIKPTDDDDLYNTLKQVFRFVVNNRRSLGVRSSDKVGMGAAERRKAPAGKKADSDVKTPETTTEVPAPGTSYDYTVTRNKKKTPMKIEIGDKDDSGKYTIIVTNKETKATKTLKKKADDVIRIAQRHGGKKALAEAKYVKDEDVKKYLRSALSFNKLEAFEEFMTKIEALRNKIRNAPNKPKDSTFNRLIAEFDKNPIMLTNISDLFEVDSKNQKELASLKAFIDDIFISLYSTRVKKGRENIIDKMASVGGGNLNALLEAYYGAADPNDSFIKDAQSRDRFKNNLIKFMEDAIRLFQHLYSKKRNK